MPEHNAHNIHNIQARPMLNVIAVAAAAAFALVACGGGGSDAKEDKTPIEKKGDNIKQAQKNTPKTAYEGEVVQLHRLSDRGLPLNYKIKTNKCTLGADGYSVTMGKALNEKDQLQTCGLMVYNGGGSASVHQLILGLSIDINPNCKPGEKNGKSRYCIPEDTTITTAGDVKQQTELGKALQVSLQGYHLHDAIKSKSLKISTAACAEVKDIKISSEPKDAQKISFGCTPEAAGSYPLTISLTEKGGGSKTIYQGNVEVKLPQVIGGSKKLSQTGVTQCANEKKEHVACTAALGGDWFGLRQDGEIQAGEALAYNKKIHNNKGTKQTDVCVQDSSTGLIWEAKTDDDGLQDKDWTYTWYNTNSGTNGGDPGVDTAGKDTCGGHLKKCNSQAYIEQLNKNNYCGYSDWRLPEARELINLVDYGREKPSINPIFEHTKYDQEKMVGGFYLSNTTQSRYRGGTDGGSVYLVGFTWGAANLGFHGVKNRVNGPVRAVRSAAAAQ